jgi:quercetin dioxygenase-like cupin family protein
MDRFEVAEGPAGGQAGFRVVAGRSDGLSRLMFVVGHLPAGDHGPMHLHRGAEILRVVSGAILIRVGEQRKVCTDGDVAIVPPDTLHGFRADSDTTLEVIAEYDIGTLFPVRDGHGGRRLVEVFRPDMPWGRQPDDGRWTSDAEMQAILDQVDADV